VNNIKKLIEIGSQAIGASDSKIHIDDFKRYVPLIEELQTLLSLKNGFYAFESALHIFPSASSDGEMTLDRWNSRWLWRHKYGNLTEGALFFGEDICGNQYCIYNGHVGFFDAEIGAIETLGSSIDQWAGKILADYETLTSFAVAHHWQQRNGKLPPGKRLMLKRPLILGGDYSPDNIFAVESVEGMRLRGHIADQIKDLPEGTEVDFNFTD
jgi:hypothetical protein